MTGQLHIKETLSMKTTELEKLQSQNKSMHLEQGNRGAHNTPQFCSELVEPKQEEAIV